MKTFFSVLLFACVMTSVARAQSAAESTEPLAIFLGHWEGGGTFFDTKLSKADKVISKGDCNWSPQGRYLLCEQTIQDSKAAHGQLTIFGLTDKPNEVRYSTFNDRRAPTSGIVTIHDNVWTFSSEFPVDGVETTVRTTNTFQDNREIFRVEYTQDKGAHWTTMLDGEQHKVLAK
jgi:hypothetical protein